MKTNIIGLKELRQNAETYIKAVARGKSYLVMRRSKPVFFIAPVSEIERKEVVNFLGERGSR